MTSEDKGYSKEESRQYWENASGDFVKERRLEEQSKQIPVYQSEFNRLLGEGTNKVLDVGTGFAYVATAIAELDSRNNVVAIDISKKMMAQAKKYTKEKNVEVSLCEAWASELPFADGEFDAVVNRLVFWALPEPEKALKEWIRVTKPGGIVVMVELEGLTGIRRLILRIMQAAASIRGGSNAEQRSLEKLPFGPIDKRLTAKQWPRYLAIFSAKEVRIRDISYIDKTAIDKNEGGSGPRLSLLYPRSLLVSFRVPETGKNKT